MMNANYDSIGQSKDSGGASSRDSDVLVNEWPPFSRNAGKGRLGGDARARGGWWRPVGLRMRRGALNQRASSASSSSSAAALLSLVLLCFAGALLVHQRPNQQLVAPFLSSSTKERYAGGVPLEGMSWKPTEATERCDSVIDIFTSKNQGLPNDILIESYAKQSVDANVFYRATAGIFWRDFVEHNWDDQIYSLLETKPDDDKVTWTWVTGDQHLSNFGAWRNRHDKVVFSVNDFDEAAIYDFHIDVLRLAVSIYNHAIANGLSKKHIKKTLQAFTDTYVDTVVGYVGNEDAITFELTRDSAEGVLRKFLSDVTKDNTHQGQLEKFTDLQGRFLRSNATRLESLNDPQLEQAIHRAFSSQQYGATMMKTGWHVPVWSDDYFKVLDVARRLGSGVGSFGVDRFYVLLNGTGVHHEHIILDVKYEPSGGVAHVLSDDDKAWYNILFKNEAARAVEAQRRLTSYVDPFTGWAEIQGNAFVVRQRSPWKDSPNLDKMTDYRDYRTFAEMTAVVTATSHTRGTVAKAPGEFKHVIASLLGDSHSAKKTWGKAVRKIAEAYSEQVKLDFQCFRTYVETHYPEAIALQSNDGD